MGYGESGVGNGEWVYPERSRRGMGNGETFDYAQGKPIKRKPIVTVQDAEGGL